MERRQEEFLKKLLEEFKVEAAEHRQAIVDGLMALDGNPEPEKTKETIEAVFREVHSLKGAARSVTLSDIERLCQAAESVFSLLKRGEVGLAPELVDLLHAYVNMLDLLLVRSGEPLSSEETGELSAVIHRIQKVSKGEEPEPVPVIPLSHTAEAAAGNETVRITISKLTDLFLQAEELITTKLKGVNYVTELRDIHSRVGLVRKSGWDDTTLKNIESDIQGLYGKMEQEFRTLGRVLDGLLSDMKKSLMFPVSSVLDLMPKLVRDLARDSGKSVSLAVRGGEIEIDRRILEEIKDPLIHMIRNSIDYGIETPDVRTGKGKNPCGTITIDVKRKDSRNVKIAVSDDGAGVDRERVIAAAVKGGIISSGDAENLSDNDVLNLLFRSGLSTSPIITDISGRGIGLAIVQEKAEKLGGAVSVESVPDQGTIFRYTLPLTQAAFRGVMVRTAEQTFIIPIQSVESVIRIKTSDIETVENRNTISLNGEIIPILSLGDVLGIHGNQVRGDPPELKPVVVLAYARRRIAFFADEVLGEQEGIIKNLGPLLQGVKNIAGATVSGTSEVIPLLDVADLMDTAINFNAGEYTSELSDETGIIKHTILVAEDSVTARSLLKNILESAGYTVKTAIDGIDAFTTLHSGGIDLLVSDVDMPRMNGFDLTAKIRSDSRLTALPVVLVTALDSREDREKGIDAGANAYIVKSSFDQSNLIEVVNRLL
ncbi:MAG TPA: response regulator [Bacteroidales bacterium]|nr:response regulator [Bacteroidales bacterium]